MMTKTLVDSCTLVELKSYERQKYNRTWKSFNISLFQGTPWKKEISNDFLVELKSYDFQVLLYFK